jgi:poly(A) polymerase
MNAMAQEVRTRAIVDPFGGRQDLDNRLIRAVGDPAARFAEDPLRLLRAVRFATTLGFTIEPATATAIKKQAAELQNISRERVAEEMNKILLAERPSRGLRLLADLGLLRYIIPEMMPMVEMRRTAERRHKDIFNHVLQVVDKSPPTLELRWAALLHDIAKPATMSYQDGQVHFFGHEVLGAKWAREILTRLHFDRHTVDRVSALVARHMRINTYDDWSDSAVRRFMREVGDQLDDLFALSRADITSHRFERVQAVLARVDELERRTREQAEQAEIAKLDSPLDGYALMDMFQRPPGPWLGKVKGYLRDLVIDGELDQNDKERGAELARAYMAEHPEL